MMQQLKDIQVVVLMGGLGTRLNEKPPKAMVDVCGKPFFSYQLNLMKQSGFRKFLFCVGYKADVIRNYFRDGKKFGVSIKYSSDEKIMLGTGGALRKALPKLEDNFMLIYGDSFMDVDYFEIVYNYFETEAPSMLAVYKNNGKYDTSNVALKNGAVIKYTKDNTSSELNYIDYGIMILSKQLIQKIPENEFIELPDWYSTWADFDIMCGYEVYNRFYEIGSPKALAIFKQYVTERFMIKKPAMFLDRDGTLNEEIYNSKVKILDAPLKVKDLKLLPNTIKALKKLQALNYRLIVITKQASAAKGKNTLSDLYAIRNKFINLLAKQGIILDGYFMCPHHPTGVSENEAIYTKKDIYLIKPCLNRKPGVGLLKRVLKTFNVDLKKSYMIGDTDTDIRAGKKVGLKTIFLGYRICFCKSDYQFENLLEAVNYVTKKN